MKWIESTIGDVCDAGGGEVKTGPFGSQLHQSDYSTVGTPVVMPKDIIEGDVSDLSIARIGPDHVDRLSKHKLNEGDIVYGRRGDIGRQALITKKTEGWLCGTGCLRVTIGKPAPVIPSFLHLYLRQNDVISWIANQAVGATMPNLNTSILRSVPVIFPESKAHQEKLADIVCSYDDLIENNNRRIAILEEMAQSLYREWFVKFRFPGHEQCQMVESPLGLIPEGWKYLTLGELVNFKRNSVKKGSLETSTPYMGLEHFPRKSFALSEWDLATEIGSSKLAFEKGDILFGKIRPYFHKVGVAQTKGLCSSDTFVLSTRESEHSNLVAMVTFSESFVAHAVQTSQGTKMPRANWDVLSEYSVPLPTNQLLTAFNGLVGPAIEQVRVLSSKNRNLKKQRDLLLPKLISGQIELSLAEQATA